MIRTLIDRKPDSLLRHTRLKTHKILLYDPRAHSWWIDWNLGSDLCVSTAAFQPFYSSHLVAQKYRSPYSMQMSGAFNIPREK